MILAVRNIFGVLLLLFTLSVCGFPVEKFQFSSDKVVDLSYPFSSDTLYWPPSREKFLRTGNEIMHNDVFVRTGHFSAGEHGGTHIDSPSHFSRNGSDIADLKIDQLTGPIVVVNVTRETQLVPDYEVQLVDIKLWEDAYGRIPEGSFVLMLSDWGKRYPNRKNVFNAEDPITLQEMHFPGFHPDTTRFLIEHRKIRGVGTDSPSTDSARGVRGSLGSHVALAEANLIGIEFTANLDKLPASGAKIIISPMKIESGSGAPSRIWAVLP